MYIIFYSYSAIFLCQYFSSPLWIFNVRHSRTFCGRSRVMSLNNLNVVQLLKKSSILLKPSWLEFCERSGCFPSSDVIKKKNVLTWSAKVFETKPSTERTSWGDDSVVGRHLKRGNTKPIFDPISNQQITMNTAIASIIFYTYVYIVCEILRRLSKKFISNDEIRCQLLELIGTVQVCTPIFDVGVVWETYGLAGVFIEIFFLELLNCFTLDEACAHPFVLLNHYRDQSFNLLNSVARLITQCVGAYLSFYLTRAFWSFRLIDEHAHLYDSGWHCHSDLTVSDINTDQDQSACYITLLRRLWTLRPRLPRDSGKENLAPPWNSHFSQIECWTASYWSLRPNMMIWIIEGNIVP